MPKKTQKQSNIVGLKELRENIDKYISRVDQGGSFTVVRRSQPIFKIVPIGEDNENWKPAADFTEVNKNGVPASEILKRL